MLIFTLISITDLKDYKKKVINATSSSEYSEAYSAKKAIDKEWTTRFSTKNEGAYHWFQLELEDELAIWKVKIESTVDCCEDQMVDMEVRVGNEKISDEIKPEENSTSRSFASITSKSELCGKFEGSGHKGDVYLIDCIRKDDQDLKGKFVTILSLKPDNKAMTFQNIEVFGEGKIKFVIKISKGASSLLYRFRKLRV